MGDISRIDLYHDLFFGCMIVFFVCAAIAVLLFFVLDIRRVVGDLTGRATKKQIQKVESENASTGRLRKKTNKSMENVNQQIQKDMGILNASVPGARKLETTISQMNPPVIANNTSDSVSDTMYQNMTEPFQEGAEGTTLLNIGEGAEGTTLLNTMEGEDGTSLLNIGEGTEDTSLLKPGKAVHGTEPLNSTSVHGTEAHNFRIEREIILIHTEEVI